MNISTEAKIAYIDFIKDLGFYIDTDRYEALNGEVISEDELIDHVYSISVELIQNKGMSTRQTCEYLYEIGKLNKK